MGNGRIDTVNCKLVLDAIGVVPVADPCIEKKILFNNNLLDYPTLDMIRFVVYFLDLRVINLCLPSSPGKDS